MHQTSNNDHDMENLMAAAKYIVFPWIPSFGNLSQIQYRARMFLVVGAYTLAA